MTFDILIIILLFVPNTSGFHIGRSKQDKIVKSTMLSRNALRTCITKYY